MVLAGQHGNVLVYKQFAVSIGGKIRQKIPHFRACLMPILVTAADTKDQIHVDEAAVNLAYLSTCPGQNASFRNGVLHVLDEVIHASCPLHGSTDKDQLMCTGLALYAERMRVHKDAIR